MRKILIGVVAVLVVLVAAVLVLPFLIPVDAYRGRLAEAASQALGRQVRFDGPIRLALFPTLSIDADKVSIAGTTPQAKPLASIGRLDLGLAVRPLLDGRFVVTAFTLHDPVADLEIGTDGKPNWLLGPAPGKPAPAPARPAPAKTAGGAVDLSRFSLVDFRIVNGAVSYLDRRTGQHVAVSAIDLRIAAPAIDKPLVASGGATWNGRKVSLDVHAASPQRLIDGRGSDLTLKLGGQPLQLAFAGAAGLGAKPHAAGDLSISAPSVRDLMAWLGLPPPGSGDTFGPFALKTRMTADATQAHLATLDLTFDRIHGAGDLVAVWAGARPALDGRLAFGTVDLAPYLGTSKPGQPANAAPQPAPAKPGTRPAADTGWSTQPIDASALRRADADLNLTFDGIKTDRLALGRTALTVALKAGRLDLAIRDMALYGGNARGRIGLDASRPDLGVSSDLTVSGVDIHPLLVALANFDRLDGKGQGSVQLTARGASQRALVESLNGKIASKVTDGAIRGVDLASMMRNIGSAFTNTASSAPQKTDFSALTADFTVNRGIAHTTDLSLLSPLLRVEGTGDINVPSRTVDLHIVPKIVPTIQGQGGQANLTGIVVPLFVRGPWANPSFTPDLAGAFDQKMGKPIDLLRNLGKSIQGGQTGGSGSSGTTTKPPKPIDVLKGLFGQ